MKERFNTPRLPAVVAGLLYAAFILIRLCHFEYDPSAFLCAGDYFTDYDAAPVPLLVRNSSDGYDGQFYYRLALDPLPGSKTAHGMDLDMPAYRSQRILYPLTARILGLGDPHRILYGLIVSNLLAVILAAWMAGRTANILGRHAAWGILVVLYPGILLAVARDLTEPWEAALLLAGTAAYLERKHMRSALFLAGAVLTKEVAILAPLAFGAAAILRPDQRGRRPAAWYLVPVAVLAAFQIHLRIRWGIWPAAESSTPRLVPPFLGIWHILHDEPVSGRGSPFLWSTEIILLWLFLSTAAMKLLRPGIEIGIRLSFLLYLILIVCLVSDGWFEDWGFFRHSLRTYLFGGLILVSEGGRESLKVWLPLAALWIAIFLMRVCVI